MRHTSLLPTYDVFDEPRYFDPAATVQPVEYAGERIGISVCEDSWNRLELWPDQRPYRRRPVGELAAQGATRMINISASHFYAGKDRARVHLMQGHVRDHGVPIVYANQVGGNDELVFDGGSFLMDARGRIVEQARYFGEDIITVDTEAPADDEPWRPLEEITAVHDALVLGISDCLRKCGFHRAVVGLSGGIDPAATCALATRALGTANVMGVTMPSMYSSEGSVSDSRQNAHLQHEVPVTGGEHEGEIERNRPGLDATQPRLAPHISSLNGTTPYAALTSRTWRVPMLTMTVRCRACRCSMGTSASQSRSL